MDGTLYASLTDSGVALETPDGTVWHISARHNGLYIETVNKDDGHVPRIVVLPESLTEIRLEVRGHG